ncbi:family 16 glycosylhydrolase [Metabacillus litoralis]|uniref:Family 16 glycosylhydrolase n=2 Tax=Metabacillus litoralis TaxID=152268 RepID=A0A5C6W1Z8_9BACI|nr:family 16 glycosylhydrolase [Metabacillus litoralis]
MFGFGRTASDIEPSVPYNITLDNVKLVKVEQAVLVQPEQQPEQQPATPTEGDTESETADSQWNLVWEDTFDGNELDTTKWNYDLGNGFTGSDGTYVSGWGNEELEFYQEENVNVEDGKLVIEAREEPVSDTHGTYDYTSGKIHTKGKFSQKYGKFEAKIKLPEGQGYWPAFWMMPQDDVYGGWAASGEIDIMEAGGSDISAIGGAIHYGSQWPNNTYTAKDYHFPEGQDITGYNVYSVEWEPGEIRWYVNGELFQTLNNWNSTNSANSTKYSYPAPFDQEFYLILNLAIGGWYDGKPGSETVFPGKMEVEYVKAYEKDAYAEPVEPSFDAEELPEGSKEAINGNYVYDRNFQEGITSITNGEDVANKWSQDYWNLVYLDNFNGSAKASVEQIGDSSFAKVDIANAGSQPYSVQLIQNVTIGKGRWYKLSFDAKSTANRNLNVKIGGGEARGYSAYSPSKDFELSKEMETYEITFQMQDETDPLARLELNMGLDPNSVWVGNVVLEETEAQDPYNENAPKTPLANGNHIYNGTFDQGRMDRMTYWNVETTGAEATAAVPENNRMLAVDISNGGESTDSIKVIQKGINLLSNDEYKLTFNSKSDVERTINVGVVSEDGTVKFAEEQIALTNTMDEKEMTFTMANVSDAAGQLVFYLGNDDSNVYLDDVKLVRLTNNNAGLSFDEIFPLKNGDFSNGLTKWVKHVQGEHDGSNSNAKLEDVDGAAKLTVNAVGTNPWDVQLFQPELSLKQGETYIVEFDAKSTIDRKLEVALDNGAPEYKRFFNEIVNLTDSYGTYSFEFEMTQDDSTNLQFMLGNVEGQAIEGSHEVFIDNVRLEVKDQGKKYFPLQNGDFSTGLSNWGKHVQGEHDGSSSSASLEEENGAAKLSIANVGQNPWDVQLFQSELSLDQGQTYVVEFDAKSSIDRKLEVVVDNGAPSYQRFFQKIVSLTDTFKTYSFEFTMTAEDVTNLQFLVGNVDAQGISSAHDVVIDNVKLEVKGSREELSGPINPEEPPVDPKDPVDESVVPENKDSFEYKADKKLYVLKQSAKAITFTKDLLKQLEEGSSIEISNEKIRAVIPTNLLVGNTDLTFNFGDVSEDIKSKNGDAVSEMYNFTITGEDGTKITNFGNNKVELIFSVNLDDVKNVKDLQVIFIDSDGNKSDEQIETTFDEVKKRSIS